VNEDPIVSRPPSAPVALKRQRTDVPRFQHKCPREGHSWEVCGIAASLIDPHDVRVEHGCSKDVEPVVVFTKAEVREVPP